MTMNESALTDIEIKKPEVQPEPQEEAKPEKQVDSTYIDYNELPESVRPKVQSRIDADFRKNKELERQYQAEKEAKRKLEKELLELRKPKDVTPPEDDMWIRDPEAARQQQQAYLDTMQKKQAWEYDQKNFEESQKRETEQQQRERIGNFYQKAQTAGLQPHEVAMAAQIVDQQIRPEVAGFLANHEYGPQLVAKLAKDPMELTQLASLDPIEAGVKLDRLAESFKASKISKAPPPDDPVKGAPTTDNPYGNLLKGSKYL